MSRVFRIIILFAVVVLVVDGVFRSNYHFEILSNGTLIRVFGRRPPPLEMEGLKDLGHCANQRLPRLRSRLLAPALSGSRAESRSQASQRSEEYNQNLGLR
ncbi:unnamed protein product [Bursaphelenchus xylophilus]|uniref:(pine wood nematode) hypothetical protein n=1 Tax=Bursaphelenchus xylophilus TaxID=6326 RepID=A0A1I7RUE2_BURXY|nr:unnamed protein product [Bursaphelenchus xylophilus]CAG9114064.1 unnamed protein product [Bursaphelenchus xylophilus]